MSDQRDSAGKFAAGNTLGRGRPKRLTEAKYMATIGQEVSLADWQTIVRRAVADAQAGDSQARVWLTRYLVGDAPPSLLSIAASEQRSEAAEDAFEDEIDVEAARQQMQADEERQCRALRAATTAILERLPRNDAKRA